MQNEQSVEEEATHKIIEGNGKQHDMELSYETGIYMYNDTCMYTEMCTVHLHVFACGHMHWHENGHTGAVAGTWQCAVVMAMTCVYTGCVLVMGHAHVRAGLEQHSYGG